MIRQNLRSPPALLLLLALSLTLNAAFADGAVDELNLIPTPQFAEPLATSIVLTGSESVRIVTGASPDPKVKWAARIIQEDFEAREPRLKGKVSVAETRADDGVAILLAGLAESQRQGLRLNLLDEQALSPEHFGQSYVLRTEGAKTVWIVGGGAQGTLFGAMTLLQLARPEAPGLTIPGISIRDYPHFEFRAAADWLLNGEVNRWALDRGRGWDGFEALARRKIDQCLRYKINMAIFDGFGWSLKKRPPEYPAVMRRLTAYARERGIHLVFGGYGASYGVVYQPGPLYEDAPYLGEVFVNRESYPDGPPYPCMGFDRARSGFIPATLGSCRGNDDLNRLKAAELQEFVRAVEPGALYIHHEDFGECKKTQEYWKQRDARCRRRWPNDDLRAPDGGAGALAHGYSRLIEAVNEVRHPETGYDASRDCMIFLTSPVYVPSSPASEDWGDALTLWRNIGKLLPPVSNVMPCFRETFPQAFGTERWIDAYNRTMREGGVRLGAMIFSIVGGDHWLNEAPFVAGTALDAHFLGARAIFHDNGDAYEEPQQLLNAEYGWNVYSTGFYQDPLRVADGRKLWRDLSDIRNAPDAIVGERGFLRRACERLYGKPAALPMTRYVLEHRDLDGGTAPRGDLNVPMAFTQIFPTPVHWRDLALDSKTWTPEIENETYRQRMERLHLSRAELHRRLMERWRVSLEMSERGRALLEEALAANPTASSREDVQFLLDGTRAAIPLARALVAFHRFLETRSKEPGDAKPPPAALAGALEDVERAERLAEEAFPHVIDPVSEPGTLKSSLKKLNAEMRRAAGGP